MTKFAAQIFIDPRGYEWENVYGSKSKEGSSAYARSLYLRWKSMKEVVRWRDEAAKGDFWEIYDPFATETALFRIFASLPPTPEAILQFANQYGDIRQPVELIIESEHSTLANWQDEISEMRAAVDEADAFFASSSTSNIRKKKANDLRGLANNLLAQTDVRLFAARKTDGLALQMYSTDLLSIMRLQFVEAIAERKAYRACEHCGKPFEVTPQVNRADRLFCSDNCRVKAYQRRKKQAIELRLEGRTLRQIVSETGSEMETVKRWLKDIKPKEK